MTASRQPVDPRLRDAVARMIAAAVRVYQDCLLPNGCLVAAPSHHAYYPRQAKSYLYCWPGRDLGFSVAGMEALGHDVRAPLLDWIWERAEDFQASGLIYEEYHPNGPRRGAEWQPDQAGTLLWVLCRSPRPDHEREAAVVRRAAQGLVAAWDGANFRWRYRDLWERRFASPQHGSHFTYTLAACAKGLSLAADVYQVEEWRVAAEQMVERLAGAFDPALGWFRRRFGPIGNDPNPDASLAGLVWPFDVLPERDRLIGMVRTIEQRLLGEQGVYRYEYDSYDGEVEVAGAELRQGAGAWPLLTFWLAIAQNRLGDHEAALRTFRIGLAAADENGHLPEQVFPPGDPRVGVKPLLWSHMMFVLAAEELGLLPAA